MRITGNPDMISVLLVDDDEDWLLLMRAALTAEGVKATTSVNGDGFWDKIRKLQPDIIFLDIEMKKGVNGEDFCPW
jgi:CheY-like chemotaxis protein